MPASNKAAFLDFGEQLYFECVTTEQTEETSEATEHHVEQGANVADHVREGLATVTLEAFLSNTPVDDVNAWYGGSMQSVELDVPKANKPIPFTPGALINAAVSAIGSLLFGDTTYKATVLKFSRPTTVVADTIDALLRWKKDGLAGKVFLPWKTYESMVITNVSVKRDPSMGDAATVSIQLREIRLVETKLVAVTRPKEPSGKTMQNKGRQPTTPAGDATDDESIAHALLKKLTGR